MMISPRDAKISGSVLFVCDLSVTSEQSLNYKKNRKKSVYQYDSLFDGKVSLQTVLFLKYIDG